MRTPVVLPARKHPIVITAILAMNPRMTLYQNPSDSQVQERAAETNQNARELWIALRARDSPQAGTMRGYSVRTSAARDEPALTAPSVRLSPRQRTLIPYGSRGRR
jgi:hypothetical protein